MDSLITAAAARELWRTLHAWLAFYEQFSAERLDALDNLLRTRTRKERSK